MKLFTPLFLFSFFSISVASAQVVVLVEEDFESAGPRALSTGNNGAALTEVADPAVGGTRGTVAAIDLSGDNQWGAVNPIPSTIIPLPVGTVPGSDTYTVTMDVYIPTDTTFDPADGSDAINLILRFNDGVDNNSVSFNVGNNRPAIDLPRDEWVTITADPATIPPFDRQEPPVAVTHVVPILSFRDQQPDTTPTPGTEAGPGIALYFDNYRLEVSVPVEDPNLAAASLSFGTELDPGTGPHVRSLSVTNTGAAEALNITAATISGANAATFMVTNTDFPIMIDPGETDFIQVTFSPGESIGAFSASLDIASNDASTAIVSVALGANVPEPFEGRQLILNGDFETGDLTYWRQDNRFSFTDVQAHSGTGAGLFTLTAGQEWGESRLDTIAPPGVEGDGNQDRLAITPEMHGKEFEYRAWYFRPDSGGMAPDDEVMTIFRWNGKQPGANLTLGRIFVGDIPVNTWTKITATNTIPAVDGDSEAVTSVIPLWSFHDVGSNSIGGELMYIDDVSMKVDVPPVPPAFDLKITKIDYDVDNDLVRITWDAVVGATYAIDRDTKMAPIFNEEVEEITADSESMTYEDTGAVTLGEPRLFYRVRLLNLP